MGYSKLIHEYLDGQLNEAREQALFSELAKSSDLRGEFNQQVQMQSAAMQDMKTLAPPAESTNAIFSQLGFSIPSEDYLQEVSTDGGGGTTTKTAAMVAALSRFWSKYMNVILATLITASLSTVLFVFTGDILKSENETRPSRNTSGPAIVTSYENPVPFANVDNETSATEVARTNEKASSANRSRAKATYDGSLAGDNERNQSLAASDENKDSEVNMLSALGKNSQLMNNSNYGIYSSQSVLDGSNVNAQNANDSWLSLLPAPKRNFNDADLAVILSGNLNVASEVGFKLTNPSNYQNLNNASLTVMYKAFDNLYIGGKVGKERFAQEFERDFNGENLVYHQEPSLYIVGGLLRYSYPLSDYDYYLKMIAPYCQVFGGITSAGGFLAEPEVGITIAPHNAWAFNIGYGFNWHGYKVDGKSYLNNKQGITFGVGLGF